MLFLDIVVLVRDYHRHAYASAVNFIFGHGPSLRARSKLACVLDKLASSV